MSTNIKPTTPLTKESQVTDSSGVRLNTKLGEISTEITTLQTSQGNLSDLTTTAKNNLVAAINEAAQSGGGGGSADWTLLREITLTEESNNVAVYDAATDGATDHLRVIMVSPDVTNWNNIRLYCNDTFLNITKYSANYPYFLELHKKGDYIVFEGMFPSTANWTQYALIAGGSGIYSKVIEGSAISSSSMRLYSGRYPVGTTFKIYKK